MKKLVTFLTFIALVYLTHGQTIALHSASGVKIFTGNSSLEDCYTDALAGDTLYLGGGSFIPPASFNKQLFVYGAGHYLDSSITTGKTFISGNIFLDENCDGFHLEGLEVTGSFTIISNTSVNQVILKYCKLNTTFNVSGNLTDPSQNILVSGSVILGNIELSNAKTSVFSNSILQGQIINTNGHSFVNCAILNSVSGSSGTSTPLYGNNNTIKNCVFRKDGYPYMITGSGNTFINSVFIHATPDFGSSPTLIGNYCGVPQADIYVNQIGYVFNYTHNYHLQSPSTWLGDDGSQAGIYGGVLPYKEGGVPSNPHIISRSIGPKTTTAGELSISIKVSAQDN